MLECFFSLFEGGKQRAASKLLNEILENNCSGYRIVNCLVTPITNQNEITEIETALEQDNGVAVHLSAALRFLSDKNAKDYRNSIKESISAVEKLVRDITGESTLGKALRRLEKNGIIIPKFLKQGFENIYTWTNETDGIRNALMTEDDNLSCSEEQFMLIVCSCHL